MEFVTKKIPEHVALIMDGNGRWAKKKLFNRVKGHKKGAKVAREIVTCAREIGIKFLTLYAFSNENWQRPKMEVDALMDILEDFLYSEEQSLCEQDIRFNTIGDIKRLPKKVQLAISKVKSATANNKTMVLNLALSYGSQQEILFACQKLGEDLLSKKVQIEDIDNKLFSSYLYTKDIPDPDILIRTSGEIRISNFLLWQIAYTEMFFTSTLWPDFSKEEFVQIINEYNLRNRRFGKVLES